MTDKKQFAFIDSFHLHILAMALMLLDHMWGTVMHGNQWMTNLGRLAFPIFAFMIAEGCAHTHDMKKYRRRILIGALLSEIPFNLMMGGTIIDPFDQNVLWTFLIALLCISGVEKVKVRHPRLAIPVGILLFFLGAMAGFLLMVDYQGYGVLMVGLFYASRGTKWWNKLLQLAGMILINAIWFRGMMIDVTLFGKTFEITQQGLAVFALIPIWLYNRRKGPGNKTWQYVNYLFYPVHMLILSLIALYR